MASPPAMPFPPMLPQIDAATLADDDAPVLLNFTVLRCKYVDVVALVDGEEKRYHLRDDVPSSVMFDMFSLQPIAQQLQGAKTPEALRRAIVALEERSYALAAAIWRHTYPDPQDSAPVYPAMQAELRAALTADQIAQVLAVFFTRRFSSSSVPTPATDPSSSNVTNLTDRARTTNSKPASMPSPKPANRTSQSRARRRG